MYIGDFRLGDTFDVKFTSRRFDTGAPATLASSPVISAYVGNSTTEITAGITLTVDFDSRTGLNNVRVVASGGNGYATASNYQLVITTGTVNSVSVVGEVVAIFSIEARSALMPTTAARTLVVDANGLADANAVKVGPTGSGTAQTAGDIYNKVSGLTFTVANKLDSNVYTWNGTAVTAPNTAGTPVVDVGRINNVSTSSVTTVSARQGTTSAVLFDGAGNVKADCESWLGTTIITPAAAGTPDVNIKSLTAGAIVQASFGSDVPSLAMRTGTAQAGAATTITLDSGASASNNFYNNTLLFITGGTGIGQSRYITAYVGATKVATVATWTTNPDNTSTFAILPGDSITATITDKTGYSLTSAYDAAKTAAQAGDAMALTSGERNSTADALLDRSNAIESGITPRGALRIGVAADAGKTNGMASAGTAHLRDVADSKNRVTATVDGSGNRTATSVDTT